MGSSPSAGELGNKGDKEDRHSRLKEQHAKGNIFCSKRHKRTCIVAKRNLNLLRQNCHEAVIGCSNLAYVLEMCDSGTLARVESQSVDNAMEMIVTFTL